MTILCVTRPVVKPARRTARKAAPFGQGILPNPPRFRRTWTDADAAWAAEAFAPVKPLDRHFDRRASESAAYDAMEHGFIPSDLSDYISRTSLVGHPA